MTSLPCARQKPTHAASEARALAPPSSCPRRPRAAVDPVDPVDPPTDPPKEPVLTRPLSDPAPARVAGIPPGVDPLGARGDSGQIQPAGSAFPPASRRPGRRGPDCAVRLRVCWRHWRVRAPADLCTVEPLDCRSAALRRAILGSIVCGPCRVSLAVFRHPILVRIVHFFFQCHMWPCPARSILLPRPMWHSSPAE